MFGCLSEHQMHLGMLVAVVGALLVGAGLGIRTMYRDEEVSRQERLWAAEHEAGRLPPSLSREWWRQHWKTMLIAGILGAAFVYVPIPWKFTGVLMVFAVPVGVANLVLVSRCRAVATGAEVDGEIEAAYRIFQRGWPYLLAVGAVVFVAALLWTQTSHVC